LGFEDDRKDREAAEDCAEEHRVFCLTSQHELDWRGRAGLPGLQPRVMEPPRQRFRDAPRGLNLVGCCGDLCRKLAGAGDRVRMSMRHLKLAGHFLGMSGR
jgi:hypothetical protein